MKLTVSCENRTKTVGEVNTGINSRMTVRIMDKQSILDRMATDLESEALSADISLEESLQNARKTRNASITRFICSSYSSCSSGASASVPRNSSALTRFLNESL